jgi:GxxExxY protein
MADLIYKNEVYAIIGAAMEVHRVLGRGFLEAVYQEAMCLELSERSIPYLPQMELEVHYKHHQLKKYYIADFVAFEKIIVEIKAINQLSSLEESQLLNYMKATGFEVGVLINFGADSLEWKRMVHTKKMINPIRDRSQELAQLADKNHESTH